MTLSTLCCSLPRHKGLYPLKLCVRNKPVLSFIKLPPHGSQQWAVSCLPPPAPLHGRTSKGSREKHADLRLYRCPCGLQTYLLVCGPPERGKTPGNSTVSTTLGNSAEDLVTASMAVTPAGSYRPQGLCLAQLCCHPAQLTPVTDREHRREGLQPTPAGSCSILSLRAQSVRGLSGPWQICRRGAGWAGLLISHSVALILASLQ